MFGRFYALGSPSSFSCGLFELIKRPSKLKITFLRFVKASSSLCLKSLASPKPLLYEHKCSTVILQAIQFINPLQRHLLKCYLTFRMTIECSQTFVVLTKIPPLVIIFY